MRFESKKIELEGIPSLFSTEYVFRFYIPTDELLDDELSDTDLYDFAMYEVKKQVNDYCRKHLRPGTMINTENLDVHFEPNESYAVERCCFNPFMSGTFEENIDQVKSDLARYRRERNESDKIYGRYTDTHEELSNAIWDCMEWLKRNGQDYEL